MVNTLDQPVNPTLFFLVSKKYVLVFPMYMLQRVTYFLAVAGIVVRSTRLGRLSFRKYLHAWFKNFLAEICHPNTHKYTEYITTFLAPKTKEIKQVLKKGV